MKKWIFLTLSLIMTMVVSLKLLDKKGFFNIDTIQVLVKHDQEQIQFFQPYLVQLQKELEIYKGSSLWNFKLSEVAQVMSTKKWIRNFRVSRSWPSGLEIEIEPQKLSLLFYDKNRLAQGFVTPITDSGLVLPEIETSQAPPLVMVKETAIKKNETLRKKAIELIKSMPLDGPLSYKKINEIGYDLKEGYWVTIAKSQLKVKMGEDQFEIKSSRVSQVLDYLEKRDLKARVIDAHLSKKVLVSLQQSP